MSWDHISQLNDGRHVVFTYCAGKKGGQPCDHSEKLDLAALIEKHGDLSTDDLRRGLRCICGARTTVTVSWVV